MAYGYTLTADGRALLLKLQAGDTMTISRIAVGDGTVPEDVKPATLKGLVHEVERSRATCTVPVVEADTLSFEIEYRNKWDDGTFGDDYTDPTGLVESFWLNEYAVFVLNSADEEIMLYYADLGEFPESVARWNGRNLVSKRYPVSISIVDDDTDIQLAFPARAFVTSDYLEQRLSSFISGVVFSDTHPTGDDWTLWLRDAGEITDFPIGGPVETPLMLETASLDAPGSIAVVDDDGSGETVTNMTDNTQSASDTDIILADK